MAIDQQGAQSLTVKIRDDLVRRIRAQEFAVGEKVPSLRTLTAEYDVAELTVHAAIRELQHAGVLESASGRGTFVRAVPDDADAPGDPGVVALQAELTEVRSTLVDLEQRLRRLEDASTSD